MADAGRTDRLAAVLGPLRERFVDGLLPKVATLRQLAIEVADGSEEAAEAARRLAHRLAGTGGSYGLPQISEAGRLAELATPLDLPAQLRELIRTLDEVLAAHRMVRPARVLLV